MKNIVYISISISFFILTLLSCKDEDNVGNQTINVYAEVKDVGLNSAVFIGHIDSGESFVAEKGFVYSSLNKLPTVFDAKIRCGSSFQEQSVSLKVGTAYYVRAYALSLKKDTVYGPVVTFKTSIAEKMTVATNENYDVGKASVTVYGVVKGTLSVDAKGFVYSAESVEPIYGKDKVTLVTSYSFTKEITGLMSGVAYHVRAFAINAKDTVYGSVITVMSEVIPPSLRTLSVLNKTRMAAIACGQFVNTGDVKEFGLCLGTVLNPSISNTKVIAATNLNRLDEDGVFGVFLDSLIPATQYYVRAYAIALDNQVYYGDNQAFGTNPIPEAEPLTWRWASNAQEAVNVGHYDGITQAMDSAMYYYKNYSNLGDWISVQYNAGVATADCNSEGWMRFGANTRYHYVGTAQHEIAHALGVGTSWNWRTLIQYDGNRTWSGKLAVLTLRVMMKDMKQTLKGDGLHFWPGGINQREEVTTGTANSYGEVIKDANMLKLNAMVLNAMRIDGLASN